uniref:MmcQ/YjbR family DNA-binding protein n=1 Tax=Muribaculum intestinale TaxID=1796646 RepID=UPI0031198BA8
MLPLCNNELTERCYHFGLTFVIKQPLTSVTVKSTPDEVDEIRVNHSSVSNPLNRSLRHWIQLNLNGDISDGEIYSLVRRAYDIVREKYSPRRKS